MSEKFEVFTAEDFRDEWANDALPSHFANRANAILNERGRVVRGKENYQWIAGDYQDINGKSVCTHEALLVGVREIGK